MGRQWRASGGPQLKRQPAEREKQGCVANPGRPACCPPRPRRKKGVRIIVTMECTEARSLNETPSRYCTQKVGCGGPGIAHRTPCAT